MPQSLDNLMELRTLTLNYCECFNSSVLRELTNLEILSMEGCGIDCGVDVLSGMKQLRWLDLTDFKEINLPSNLIGSFVKLEELHGYRLEEQEEQGKNTEGSLFELKPLSKLVALSMEIEDSTFLPKGFCFPNLRCYHIRVGGIWTRRLLEWTREERALELKDIEEESVIISTFNKLLATVQNLYLEGCLDLHALPARGFSQELEILQLECCPEMETVFEFQVNENVSNIVQLQFLRVLRLTLLMKLRHIWKGPTRSVSLCNLTEVVIHGCWELKCIFPSPSLATSLQQLEILKIGCCDDLEEVISSVGGSEDDLFSCCCCFRNLRELEVYFCPKVRAVFPINKSIGIAPPHLQSHRCCLPKLQGVVLNRNEELEHVFGHQTRVGCPSLQKLKVEGCHSLMSTHFATTLPQVPSVKLQRQDGDLAVNNITCFSFLRSVELEFCKKLKQVLTTSLATSLEHLEELSIMGCDELEQVVVIAEDGEGKRDKNEVNLQGVAFQKLRKIYVRQCGKLKTIFPISVALPELQDLHLENNAVLENVFGQSDWEYTSQCPSLKRLHITYCPKMCTQSVSGILSPSAAKFQFGNKIILGDVHQGAEEIALLESQNDRELLISGLEHLCPKNMVEVNCKWYPPTQNICFAHLWKVEVVGCKRLKHLFPTTVVPVLPKLKMIIVERCNELEHIIFMVEGEKSKKTEPTATVVFDEMLDLTVKQCGKLKTIFPISIALPQLQSLHLERNAELEHVFGGSDWDYISHFPHLEELSIMGCPKMCTEFAASITSSSATKALQTLALGDIPGVEKIMQLERQSNHDDEDELLTFDLRSLSLQNLVELKCIWHGPAKNICFARLYEVKLVGCSKLKNVFEIRDVATTLPQLQEVTIEKCNELEQVIVMVEDGKEGDKDAKTQVTSGAIFQKLRTLHVRKCGKLKTIFSVPIALPKLQKLQLESNAELEHVFGRSDWDYTSKFPSLEELSLLGCPRMCTEFIANIQIPSAAKAIMEIKLGDVQGIEELMMLHQGQDDNVDNFLTSHLQTLYLRNIAELKCIWRGPKQNILFANLCKIEVIGCNRLKHLFTTTIARSLHLLEKLIVCRCNELEQVVVVADDGKEEGNYNGAKTALALEVDFKKLKCLDVSECEKLKTIFPNFIPLPKLECLRLESNKELECVFGKSHRTSHWSNLTELSFAACPKMCTQFGAAIVSLLQVQPIAKQLKIVNLSNIRGVEELIRIQGQDEEEQKLEILKLEEVAELTRIWNRPTQKISFSALEGVRVIGCNRLKQLFTATMVTTLHNLRVLAVERCNDLELVVMIEEENVESVQQIVFPELNVLRLIDLPNLISFCPTSCNLTFPSLAAKNNVKVEGCPDAIAEIFRERRYEEDHESSYFMVDIIVREKLGLIQQGRW